MLYREIIAVTPRITYSFVGYSDVSKLFFVVISSDLSKIWVDSWK
jgi:hypothetical protein